MNRFSSELLWQTNQSELSIAHSLKSGTHMDYKRLRSAEKELDKAVLRQRLLIEESHCQRIKCVKRLRVFVDSMAGELRVSGRIVNDYRNFTEMKMSDVLMRFCMQIFHGDRAEILEWVKGKSRVDSFYVSGVESAKRIRIAFEFANLRDVFRLSDPLQRMFNKRTENRTSLLIDLWKYVRVKNLIRKGVVHCNDELREAFKVDTFKIEELDLKDHLLPIDPLVIDVKIGKREIFDVEMELDDLVDFPVLYTNKKVHALNRKIEELQAMIRSCNDRISVLEQFSADPVGYIDRNVVDDRRCFFYDPLVQNLIFKLVDTRKGLHSSCEDDEKAESDC